MALQFEGVDSAFIMQLDFDLLFLFFNLNIGLIALLLPSVPLLNFSLYLLAHVVSSSADHLHKFLTAFGVVYVVRR